MPTAEQQGILDDLGLTDLINKYGKSLAPIALGLIVASAGSLVKNETMKTALTLGGVVIAGLGAYKLYQIMYPSVPAVSIRQRAVQSGVTYRY